MNDQFTFTNTTKGNFTSTNDISRKIKCNDDSLSMKSGSDYLKQLKITFNNSRKFT